MFLNTIKPALGSKKDAVRVGRGIGSGIGKTCGRGHKGQKARAGGFHKVGFEGGQTPKQRRLPKFGFKTLNPKHSHQLRLSELDLLPEGEIDLLLLKATGLIPNYVRDVKVIKNGELTKKLDLKGIAVTKGAKHIIETLGGSVN